MAVCTSPVDPGRYWRGEGAMHFLFFVDCRHVHCFDSVNGPKRFISFTFCFSVSCFSEKIKDCIRRYPALGESPVLHWSGWRDKAHIVRS